MKFVTIVKRGNACHMDLSGVMGNAQSIKSSDVKVTIGEEHFVIDRKCLKADGSLKKRYLPAYRELVKKLSAKAA